MTVDGTFSTVFKNVFLYFYLTDFEKNYLGLYYYRFLSTFWTIEYNNIKNFTFIIILIKFIILNNKIIIMLYVIHFAYWHEPYTCTVLCWTSFSQNIVILNRRLSIFLFNFVSFFSIRTYPSKSIKHSAMIFTMAALRAYRLVCGDHCWWLVAKLTAPSNYGTTPNARYFFRNNIRNRCVDYQ